MGKTEANMDYLKLNLDISNREELRSMLLSKCEKLNFKLLAQDVEPFIFSKNDVKKVLMFYEYIKETL